MSRRNWLATGAKATLLISTSIATSIGIAPYANQAWAQTTPQTAAAANIEEVVVTGSRITTTGFTAPTPVTVVTAEELNQTHPLISEALADLPVMSVGSQRTAGIGTGGSGQATINLRQLGAARTLVLLDSRRFTPSATAGTVDTSQMPNALITRVDVVTGGASAAYGSDAVAGVVNYVLNKTYVGFKGSVEGGISAMGDTPEYQGSLAAGVAFGSGRGHFLISLEGYDSTGLFRRDRDFAVAGLALITNPCPTGAAVSAACPTGANGLPNNLRVTNAKQTNGATGGLIIGGPLAGITFDADGTPRPFKFGTLVGTAYQVGGEGARSQIGGGSTIVGDLTRANIFNRLSYDMSDSVTVFGEFSGATSKNVNSSGYPFAVGSTAFKITRDNAYLPASIAAQMATLKLANITVGKLFNEFPDRPPITNDTTYRFVAGVDFTLGDWKGEAYFQNGYNRRQQAQPQQLDQINTYPAADAVIVPANTPGLVAGTIACRSSLTNPKNGCIPLDIFGPGVASQEAIKWLTAAGPTNVLRYTQRVGAASISGPAFDGWAGPISVATGAEYKEESLNLRSDPYSQVFNPVTNGFGGYLAGSQLPYTGSLNVKEAFAETNIPLAKGANMAEEASVNAAFRVTDYSTSGTVNTWKIGGIYSPVSDLRFRATRSRDIRAPNLAQLYQSGGSGTTTILDPKKNVQVGGVKTITSGNPNLKPEVADTTVYGVVLNPRWIDNLSISVDHYSIDIAGAIANISTANILNGCYGLGVPINQSFCSLVVRDSSDNLTAVLSAPVNSTITSTSGWDVEASLREQIPSEFPVFGDGDVTVRELFSYLSSLSNTPQGGTATDTAPMYARWRSLTQLTFKKGPVTAFLQERYISGGLFNVTFVEGGTGLNGVNNNHVPGTSYLDGRIGYQFEMAGGNWEAYFAMNNLLNKKPPAIEGSGTEPGFTDTTYYDVVGRYFRFGFNFKF